MYMNTFFKKQHYQNLSFTDII